MELTLWYDAGMRRRVVNVLAVVSAVVCVLSLMLVGRSFFRADGVWIQHEENYGWGASSADAKLVLQYVHYYFADSHYFSREMAELRPNLDDLWQDLTGIRWLGIGWGASGGARTLILPLWVVPIVSGVLPVWWWRVRRRAGGRGFAVEAKGSSLATEETGDTG